MSGSCRGDKSASGARQAIRQYSETVTMTQTESSVLSSVRRLVRGLSRRARQRRAQIFRSQFVLDADTRVLDLGSEDGSHIHSVLAGTDVRPENVYIADIEIELPAMQRGQQLYGYNPVPIDETGRLPFEDRYFDVVHCSSVIEHVTVPKAQVWLLTSGQEFRTLADGRQREFAREVMRVGRQFFVQTPNRRFIVESHSWLPLLGWAPRRLLIPLLRLTNRFWVKKTSPDWRLLTGSELSSMFDGAPIVRERFLGLTKSVIALRSDRR
jgi:Methyltransferase domain